MGTGSLAPPQGYGDRFTGSPDGNILTGRQKNIYCYSGMGKHKSKEKTNRQDEFSVPKASQEELL